MNVFDAGSPGLPWFYDN